MEPYNLHIYTIEQLQKILGGRCTSNNDFLVCINPSRAFQYEDNPLRASASGIMLCTKGSCKASVNMQNHDLQKGSVLMYGAESIVEFSEVSEDFEYNMLIFTHKLIEDTFIDLKSVIPIFKYISENIGELILLEPEEQLILERFYQLFYDITALEKIVIIKDLLAGFVRTVGEIYNRRLSETPLPQTRQEEYFQKFMRLISVHYKKERSVKFYADSLHITPKYLSTLIKDISGRSATTWINNFVVQQAKMLLKFSGKSVQEITYELNFSTQSFFGKYFKRHTGLSPSEYRRLE